MKKLLEVNDLKMLAKKNLPKMFDYEDLDYSWTSF